MAENLLYKGEEWWKKVLFSDEKKFRLDGPDGNRRAWVDTRAPARKHQRRQAGGGGIMIWLCFGYFGVGDAVEVKGNVNSEKYVEMLEEHLFFSARRCVKAGYIFQQDNAPGHRSAYTKAWFAKHKIPLLMWPAYSPDCNPVENLWRLIQNKVYAENKRYFSLNQLKQAIDRAVAQIDKKT